MKMSIASKFMCPDASTYQLVEALKDDNVALVAEGLRTVDPKVLITASELYDIIQPKERTITLSLLHIAVIFLAEKSVETLLSHPLDVNFADESVSRCPGHGPALLVLCRVLQSKDYGKGHAILRMLLDKGAKTNVYDFIGTPLSYRACAGDLFGVQLLLQAKADPHVVVLARRFSSDHIEKHFLLRTLVHDIEDRKQKNEDQEGVAARVAIVQELLEAGAIPYLNRSKIIGGQLFEERSAATIATDKGLLFFFERYKEKKE